jgi:hypothetical protein
MHDANRISFEQIKNRYLSLSKVDRRKFRGGGKQPNVGLFSSPEQINN